MIIITNMLYNNQYLIIFSLGFLSYNKHVSKTHGYNIQKNNNLRQKSRVKSPTKANTDL